MNEPVKTTPNSRGNLLRNTFLVVFTFYLIKHFGITLAYEYLRYDNLYPEFPYFDGEYVSEGKCAIYLVPVGDFDKKATEALSFSLMDDTGLRVCLVNSVSLENIEPDKSRGQYTAESLLSVLDKISDYIASKRGYRGVVIGITEESMYTLSRDWRYAFQTSWDGGLSMISTFNFVPTIFTAEDRARKIYGDRLYKVAKRTIGEHHFRLPRTDNRNSVMYSPIMRVSGLDDLPLAY